VLVPPSVALDRQHIIARRRIAGNELHLHAEKPVHGAHPRRRDLIDAGDADRARPLAQVVHVLDRRGVPEEDNRGGVEQAADRQELAGIVFDLRILEQLLHGEGRGDHDQRGAVLRRQIVGVVRRDGAAGARHVARNDGGIARQIFAEIAGDQPRIGVVGAARPDRDDERDGLAAIEILVVAGGGGGGRQGQRQQQRQRQAQSAD
jgi:hypothetical protein